MSLKSDLSTCAYGKTFKIIMNYPNKGLIFTLRVQKMSPSQRDISTSSRRKYALTTLPMTDL